MQFSAFVYVPLRKKYNFTSNYYAQEMKDEKFSDTQLQAFKSDIKT